MQTPRFLPYAQHCIPNEDHAEIAKSLSLSIITRGENTQKFENEVAEYCGARFAVAFSSGTAALRACYFAADVGAEDRVLTTPNTFVASIAGGIQGAARPVLVDIDRKTGNLNLEYLSHNMRHDRSRGKTVIVPVHFSGIPVDMQKIDQMIMHPDTVVIEDAAHAFGSKYENGSRVGSCLWSDLTIFSFHPAKTITTGEGGMVLTNDQNLFHKLQLFRNNGIEREAPYLEAEPAMGYYEVKALTGNFHLNEIQAVLGLTQLRRVDQFISKRQKLLTRYQKLLEPIEEVEVLTADRGLFVCPHLCAVQINFKAYKKSRTRVMEELLKQEIGTQVHYIPIYRHPFFKKMYGELEEYFPEMETYYERALSLPLFYGMELEDVDRVVSTLHKTLR